MNKTFRPHWFGQIWTAVGGVLFGFFCCAALYFANSPAFGHPYFFIVLGGIHAWFSVLMVAATFKWRQMRVVVTDERITVCGISQRSLRFADLVQVRWCFRGNPESPIMVRLMTASANLRIRFIQFPQSQWAELVETLRRSIPDAVEQNYWGTRN
jgi:hypothetical protein